MVLSTLQKSLSSLEENEEGYGIFIGTILRNKVSVIPNELWACRRGSVEIQGIDSHVQHHRETNVVLDSEWQSAFGTFGNKSTTHRQKNRDGSRIMLYPKISCSTGWRNALRSNPVRIPWERDGLTDMMESTEPSDDTLETVAKSCMWDTTIFT